MRDIWDEFARMREEMDEMFGRLHGRNLLEGPGGAVTPYAYKQPLVDVYETESSVIVNAEMPGVDKKDIKINVNEDGVEIKVEKKHESESEDKGYYRMERSYSGFYRSLPLPAEVDPDRAEGEYKDGVLKLTLPKIDKGGKRKEVTIK